MPDPKGSRAIRLDNDLIERLCRVYDVNGMELTNTPQKPSDGQTVREKGGLDKFTDSSDSLTGKEGYESPHNIPSSLPIKAHAEQALDSLSDSADCQTVKPDTSDAIKKLQSIKSAPTIEHYIDYAVTILRDPERGKSLVEHLRQDGRLTRSPDGHWTWS